MLVDGNEHRVILLNHELKENDVNDLKKSLTEVAFEIEEKNLEIGYENLSADEILRSLLPTEVEVPTSYETIGHIAHLNLRPEHEPYK